MNMLKIAIGVVMIAIVMLIMALVLKWTSSIWLILIIVGAIYMLGRAHNVLAQKLQVVIGKIAAWIVKKFDVPIS